MSLSKASVDIFSGVALVTTVAAMAVLVGVATVPSDVYHSKSLRARRIDVDANACEDAIRAAGQEQIKIGKEFNFKSSVNNADGICRIVVLNTYEDIIPDENGLPTAQARKAQEIVAKIKGGYADGEQTRVYFPSRRSPAPTG